MKQIYNASCPDEIYYALRQMRGKESLVDFCHRTGFNSGNMSKLELGKYNISLNRLFELLELYNYHIHLIPDNL